MKESARDAFHFSPDRVVEVCFMLSNCRILIRLLIFEFTQLNTKSSHIRLVKDIKEMVLRSLKVDGFGSLRMGVVKAIFYMGYNYALSEGGINGGAEGGMKSIHRSLVNFDWEINSCG